MMFTTHVGPLAIWDDGQWERWAILAAIVSRREFRWGFAKCLFAAATGLASIADANAEFAAIGARDPDYRLRGRREEWERYAVALERVQRAAQPVSYDPKQRYEVGATFVHPKFGTGTVTTAGSTTIVVAFDSGPRTLAVGRG